MVLIVDGYDKEEGGKHVSYRGLCGNNHILFPLGGRWTPEVDGWEETVRKILSDAKDALETGSATQCTEALEKVAEMGKILSEVILYDPGSYQSLAGDSDSAEEA